MKRLLVVVLGLVLAMPPDSFAGEGDPPYWELTLPFPEPARCICHPHDTSDEPEVLARLDAAREAALAEDYETAYVLYRALAEEGNAEGQYRVGQYYLFGRAVQQNSHTASLWFEQSATNGHVAGAVSQSIRLRQGDGVSEDDLAATELVAWASACNYPPAQTSFGNRLVLGLGVEVDIVEGWKWIEISKANDSPYWPGVYFTWVDLFQATQIDETDHRTVVEVGRQQAQDWLEANPGPVCGGVFFGR